MVTANLLTGAEKNTPTIPTFAKRMQEFGCQTAYSLDGGQTAAIVTNGELMNRPDYGYQRQISDIIYFATAIPNGD
jgi:exopolysaccharide biosynthesis protein